MLTTRPTPRPYLEYSLTIHYLIQIYKEFPLFKNCSINSMKMILRGRPGTEPLKLFFWSYINFDFYFIPFCWIFTRIQVQQIYVDQKHHQSRLTECMLTKCGTSSNRVCLVVLNTCTIVGPLSVWSIPLDD